MPPENFTHDTAHALATQQEAAALPCDAYHHYYHYQSSAQYLWLAEAYCGLAAFDEALAAYTKALFQDHFNPEALMGKRELEGRSARKSSAPAYSKHPHTDAKFCRLIAEPASVATPLHDKAVAALNASDFRSALDYFNAAISADPEHSNSHFGRGKCHFLERDYASAVADFKKALQFSHQRHDAYHRLASDAHIKRGKTFLKKKDLDLAIADFTKALDLWRHNKDALKARAEAYQKKGNAELAELDKKKAAG